MIPRWSFKCYTNNATLIPELFFLNVALNIYAPLGSYISVKESELTSICKKKIQYSRNVTQ